MKNIFRSSLGRQCHAISFCDACIHSHIPSIEVGGTIPQHGLPSRVSAMQSLPREILQVDNPPGLPPARSGISPFSSLWSSIYVRSRKYEHAVTRGSHAGYEREGPSSRQSTRDWTTIMLVIEFRCYAKSVWESCAADLLLREVLQRSLVL